MGKKNAIQVYGIDLITDMEKKIVREKILCNLRLNCVPTYGSGDFKNGTTKMELFEYGINSRRND